MFMHEGQKLVKIVYSWKKKYPNNSKKHGNLQPNLRDSKLIDFWKWISKSDLL